MKRIAYTAVVAFWSVALTLVLVGLLVPEDAVLPMATITAGELRGHANPDDCWIVVNDGVYDVTRYIPLHPTRPQVITDWCEQDATEAFVTKGYGRPHSRAAWEMLEAYRVGTLAP